VRHPRPPGGVILRRRPRGGRADDGDPYEGVDGVEIVYGAAETDGEGCGEPYYLSFVRFEDGREIDPEVPAENVSFDFR
jgi:hypothetical protein